MRSLGGRMDIKGRIKEEENKKRDGGERGQKKKKER